MPAPPEGDTAVRDPHPPGARPSRRRSGEAGRQALHAYLRLHRQKVPPALRVSLAVGATLAAVYVLIVVLLASYRPGLAADAVRLLGFTYVAGREPALFAVYHSPTPMPVSWATLFSSLDDVATLLLAVPAMWVAFDRLRDVPVLDGFVRALGTSLAERRRFLDRWGLVGLVAFLWLPGLGTGPVVAGALGVLVGMPLARLLPALAASAVAVNLFWALALRGTSDAVPHGGLWDLLPTAVIVTVVAASLAVAVLRHRHRFLLVFPVPRGAGEATLAALRVKGFEPRGDALVLDVRPLAPSLGLDPRRLAPCHWAAQMLLLPTMEVAQAGRLARLGVTGVRDLAILPPSLVVAALGDIEAEEEARSWNRAALEFLARNPPAFSTT